MATIYIGEWTEAKTKKFFVAVDHKKYHKVTIESEGGVYQSWQLKKTKRTKRSSKGSLAAGDGVQAPVPGVVRAIQVKPGDSVTEGQILFIIESMKMEFEVKSMSSTVIDKVLVSESQQVDAETTLASFKK